MNYNKGNCVPWSEGSIVVRSEVKVAFVNDFLLLAVRVSSHKYAVPPDFSNIQIVFQTF